MKVKMVVGVVLAIVAVTAALLMSQFQNQRTDVETISTATTTEEIPLNNDSTPADTTADPQPLPAPTTPITTTPEPTPRPMPIANCFVGGCSGQLCTDSPDMASTCEWREEYACFRTATCERQASGQCGWTETAELKACLAAGGETF